MRDLSNNAGLAEPAPGLLMTCGVLGVLGSLALIAGNVIGSIVVPGHDWVADTVSDLAAGRFEIIQDVALYGFAVGILAIGMAAAHLHLGKRRWTIGVFALMALALIVTVIGARNEYGDRDTGGLVIHIYLVYMLGVVFPLAPFTMAGGLERLHTGLRRLSFVCAGLWCVGAPIFFLMPTGYDGAWERGLGVITAVWITATALAFFRYGWREMREGTV